MKTLSQFLQERFTKSPEMETDNFMCEGLILDIKNRLVKLNDSTEGVDFNEPIYWTDDNDIDIISIFKRTSLKVFKKETDGNPFIYALKNKNGWRFDITDAEIHKYLRKFIENCSKLQRRYDTIIMIPSKSSLNKRFMEYLYKNLNAKAKYESILRKKELNHDELEQFINYDKIEKELHPKDYSIHNKIEDLLYELNDSGREFEAKMIDKRYLKYINFLELKGDEYTVENITDKNVLILDDIYSSGSSISNAAEIIKQNYEPKSITAVTLLSKKF